MRYISLVLIAVGLMIAGCANQFPPPSNNSSGGNASNGHVPPGYEAQDYCKQDSDCVRLSRCCDCGLGEYVNIYHQQPECQPNQPHCMCAIMLSKGACEGNRCVAVSAYQASGPTGPSGFCGASTNATCSTDSDCMKAGCSGQICQAVSEKPVITTCEYRDCYDAAAYGVKCGCASGRCQWQ